MASYNDYVLSPAQSHCKFPILPEKNCSYVQFHLFPAMVLDAENSGITVAWYVTSRASTTSVESFLESLMQAARKIKPNFKFGSVGCDDDDAEINAIKWVLVAELLLQNC